MLKVLGKFAKVIGMLTLLLLLNPHRAILIPFVMAAAVGSWVAGKLEDICVWISEKAEIAKHRFWMVGEPLSQKIDEDIKVLTRMVKEIENRHKTS